MGDRWRVEQAGTGETFASPIRSDGVDRSGPAAASVGVLRGAATFRRPRDRGSVADMLFDHRSRSSAFACVLGLFVAAAVGMSTANAADRPNVLFIISDDLNCHLGCYGHDRVESPNIDRLAATGRRFTRAYCQVPLCSPSRTSMLTGQTPSFTGIRLNPGAGRFSHEYARARDFRQTRPDLVTLPQLFREAGYFSARVGKLFHYGVPGQIGTSGQDDAASWDFVVNPAGRDKAEEHLIFSLVPGAYGGTLSWLAQDGTDDEQTDGLAATAALSLLRQRAPGKGTGKQAEHEGKPFFLAVGFYRPHTPYVAPKPYFDRYDLAATPLPAHSSDDAAHRPAAAYQSGQKITESMSDEQRREAIRAYHASVTFMDAQVGRLLDGLDELGLAENTIVVFTSDHGYHLYDHNLWQKRSLFENSARVPLIVRTPNASQPGVASDSLVELIDLYPTLADLAGLQPPEGLAGDSLRPILDDPAASVQDAAFTEIHFNFRKHGYSVRTDRYRYSYWTEGLLPDRADDPAEAAKEVAATLFDMQADPEERSNLIGDPASGEIIQRLRRQIDGYLDVAGPATLVE